MTAEEARRAEKLRQILENQDADGDDDEDDQNGGDTNELDMSAGEGGKEDDNASMRSADRGGDVLTKQSLTVLQRLNQRELISVIERVAGGATAASAIANIGKAVIETLEQASRDQYTTLQNPSAIATSPPDYGAVDLATGEAFADGGESGGTGKASAQMDADTAKAVEHVKYMAKYTPVRLSFDERKFLRLLEGTLDVSEYTDRIDIFHSTNKARKTANEIKQVCAVLSGLVVAHNYSDGQRLIQDRDFRANEQFFQAVFEIGRRYKILNPERMRDGYGKLVYLLMDSQKREIKELLGFECVIPVKTVGKFLVSKKGGEELLSDPLILTAIQEIIPEGKPRSQVQHEIKLKEAAIKQLARKYATHGHRKLNNRGAFTFITRYMPFSRNSFDSDSDTEEDTDKNGLSVDEIEQSLYSLADHNTYLRYNRDPCQKMLDYLEANFEARRPESDELSLRISPGVKGARLNHSHERQYSYVRQSLILWREVLSEMHALWTLAESDLLNSKHGYRLSDTGQGLQRVQFPPKIDKAMSVILQRAQRQVGGWIGSSVVHLGDNNVPNALMFIDKYTQVPRILGPLVLCLDKIPEIANAKTSLGEYIRKEFGGGSKLIKLILTDFFRHAFDGSGADNFFDAGSCIDGRLTSAWNWCSQVEKKRYFPVFLLAGFTGFDGSFR